MRGEAQRGACPSGGGAGGLGGRSAWVHTGARVVYRHLAAKPAQGSVCLSTRWAPPVGTRAPALCLHSGCSCPPPGSPRLPETAGQCGGSSLVAAPCGVPRRPAPTEALGKGRGAAGCPAARRRIRETCVARGSVPSTSGDPASSAAAQRHWATRTAVPSGDVLAAVSATAPARGALTSGTPGSVGQRGGALGAWGAARERCGLAGCPQLSVPLPWRLRGLPLAPWSRPGLCGRESWCSRVAASTPATLRHLQGGAEHPGRARARVAATHPPVRTCPTPRSP